MSGIRNLIVLALLTCGALAIGALSHKFLSTTVTQAQQVEPPRPAEAARPPVVRRRWEYCSLTRAGNVGATRGSYWISYFNEGGVQVSVVEEQVTEQSGPAKAIARLGDDGWEMVGQGPLEIRQGALPAIYFKRLKQ